MMPGIPEMLSMDDSNRHVFGRMSSIIFRDGLNADRLHEVLRDSRDAKSMILKSISSFLSIHFIVQLVDYLFLIESTSLRG